MAILRVMWRVEHQDDYAKYHALYLSGYHVVQDIHKGCILLYDPMYMVMHMVPPDTGYPGIITVMCTYS